MIDFTTLIFNIVKYQGGLRYVKSVIVGVLGPGR